ncbi:MAG: hypothetical protein QM677_07015 [Microbacterium sp.]
MSWVPMFLAIGVPLIFTLIVGIIGIVGLPRRNPELGVRTAAEPGRPPTGRWNMRILSGFGTTTGSGIGSIGGIVEVTAGVVRFTRDGASQPDWTYPCAAVAVRPQTAFHVAAVLLFTPDGQLSCDVSRETINRFSRNTLKSLREPGYAREFAETLWANGAQP